MKLTADALAIGYPGHPVAHGLSLETGPGEVLCLLGPNGCGKTTLFRTLLGLLAPRGGRVSVDDSSLQDLSRPQIARRMGYVPQDHGSPFAYTALEVVLMGRTARLGPFSAPGPADRRVALDALRRLGVVDLAERDYTQVSGGQRQLILIARALAQEAPLLVMDEPTASLDFGNQALVIAEVARLAAEGLSVVLSTHDPDHAFAVATQVLLLGRGTVVAQGVPAEVLTAATLSKAYGISVSVESLWDGRRVCVPAVPPRKSAR